MRSKKTLRHYTGMSEEVSNRMTQHNSGKVKSTKSGIPWELIYQEEISVEAKVARKREKYLKSAAGKRWLKKMLESLGFPV